MSGAQRYELRTVGDFLAVPPEKREHCLKDFRMWIDLHAEFAEVFKGISGAQSDTSAFVWIDDDRHDIHVHATFVGIDQ